MKQNTIPKGYKKTKLGVIPEDWRIKPISNVFEFINTNSLSRSKLNYDISGNSIYNIHYGDIHATYIKPILDFNEENKIPIINDDVILSDNTVFLQDGDLIIADASEDYEGVGKAIELKNINGHKVIAGLHTFALRDKTNETSIGFRAYIFKNQKVSNRLKTIATGSKVYGISKANLAKFDIILPPLPEQKRIAQILTTWDKAINNYQLLIVNYQLKKKALMQKLLVPKKDWKEVRLGEVCNVIMGQSPDSVNYNSNGKGLYLIQGNADIQNRTSKPRIWTSQITKICEVGDVLMTVRAPVGAIAKSIHKACIGRGMCSISFKVSNIDFIYHWLVLFEDKWVKYEQGSTFTAVNSSDIKMLKINIPNYETQTKIANILSSADKELELLEKQLTKLKEQKKGLMQVLLSGQKRVK